MSRLSVVQLTVMLRARLRAACCCGVKGHRGPLGAQNRCCTTQMAGQCFHADRSDFSCSALSGRWLHLPATAYALPHPLCHILCLHPCSKFVAKVGDSLPKGVLYIAELFPEGRCRGSDAQPQALEHR